MNFFVTGGSRGIGAAIVLQAVREGHDVAFTYMSGKEGAEAIVEQAAGIDAERKCVCYKLDVRDSAMVEKVGDEVLDAFEDIHVVVNNAGVNGAGLAAHMTDEEWHRVVDTNLNGTFYVSRFFLGAMLMNRFGRIINIGSVVSRGLAGQAHYAASKSALIGFTRALAKEYGQRGITTNLLSLGYFKTELTEETMSEEFHNSWMTYCPMRRTGEMEEVTKVVTFLATDGAGFINGAEIPVSGGLDDWN